MVQICCVDGCDDSKEDVTYFKFPNSRTLRRRWLDAFTPCCKVTVDSVVCSKHFLEDEYETVRGKKRLKAKVIPTIFCIQEKPNNDTTSTGENEEIPAKTNTKTSSTDSKDTAITPKNNHSSTDTEVTTETTEYKHEENKMATDTETTTETTEHRHEENKMATDAEITTVTTKHRHEEKKMTTDAEITTETTEHRHEKNKKATNTIHNGNNDDIGMATSTINNNNSQNIFGTVPSAPKIDPESNPIDDIEDIITNYLIRQTRPLNKETQTQTQEERTNGEMEISENGENRDGERRDGETGDIETIDVDSLKDPVFIEVSVDKAESDQINQDCLMLLESVQCEVDPTNLVFQEPESDNSSDVIDLGEKKEDPISLLTSSDEDEVIIEEPEIDTVEVSDETDEDDVPLVRLVDKSSKKSKKMKSKKSTKSTKTKSDDIAKILWGVHDYFCVQCHFKTTSRSEYRRHMSDHMTVIQICQICSYTTASKSQFARHKRKHLGEKKFKCHLCDYKARHSMSLIYHMKTHESGEPEKTEHLKHKRHKGPKVHKCGCCNYTTTRLYDMKRHVMSRHT